MAAKKVRAHLFIKGKVQGVFYRFWTKNEAQKLGLAGWVRNLADGRVEAVFEGPKRKIEEMVAKCRQGPRLAKVEHLDISWEEATGEFDGFSILPTA